MTNTMLTTWGALVVAGTVALSAQAPARPATPAPRTQPVAPQRAEDKTITVTGCVKTWDPSMSTSSSPSPGTPVPGAVSAGPTRYVLTSVESDMTSSSSAGSTAAVAAQYALTAEPSVNLSAHVNHKVRITGKATPAAPVTVAPAGTATGTRPTDPERGERTTMATPMPSLAATSLTMVSASCATTSQH